MRFAATTTALLSSLCLLGSTPTIVSGQYVTPGCAFEPESVNEVLPQVGLPGTAPRKCFDFNGTERCYYTYIPASCGTSSQKVPLVVDIHGLTDCPSRVIKYTGWAQRAEEECLVVMLPSASMDPRFKASCYNLQGLAPAFTFGQPDGNNAVTTPCCCADETVPDGLFGAYDTPDDTAFVKMAIDTVLADFPNDASGLSLDANRVYMGGHSNGCMTSMSVAARYSDTIAAVCCQSGALITGFEPDYSPVPIHMVYGRKDLLVFYDGATTELPGLGFIGLWSHDQTYDYLLQANGCQTSSLSPFEDPATGETVGSIVEGGSCTNDATVQFLTLDEAGHQVYPGNFIPELGGSQVTTDLNKLAWDFCKVYSKPTPAPTDSPTASPTTKSDKKKKSKTGKNTKAGKNAKK